MSTIYVIQKQIVADDKSFKWLDSSHIFTDFDSASKGFHSACNKYKAAEFILVARETTETVILSTKYPRPKISVSKEDDF